MLSEKYLQKVIESKDIELAAVEADENRVVVSWAICDGALVIYDPDDPPSWFQFERDEDGNSMSISVCDTS